jgi:hypothetical protein
MPSSAFSMPVHALRERSRTPRRKVGVAVLLAVAATGVSLAPAAASTTDAGCSFTTSPSGDRIRPGTTLEAGELIVSRSGDFTFGVTEAGSLELKNTETGGRRWDVQGDPGASLVLAADGTASLVSPDGSTAWRSAGGTSCTELVVEDSGRVAAIDHGGSALRWTAPASAATAPVAAPVDDPDPAPAGTRNPALHPFTSSSPWNTSLGSGARFESASATRTADLLSGSPAVNSSRWSFAVYRARSTDPLVTVKNIKDGRTYQVRIPAGATTTYGTDKHMGVINPDGTTAYEFYKMTRVDSRNWTTTRVTLTDLRGDGAGGSRASSTSIFAGLIRSHELRAGKINHALAMGIPNSMLKMGYVWPALSQDKDGSSLYSGTIPMGSLVAIPPSVNIDAMGLSPEGEALGRALQDYGAYVAIRASTVAVFCELSCDAAQANTLNKAWWELYPHLRVVTNNSETNVGGGGTPRVATLPEVS